MKDVLGNESCGKEQFCTLTREAFNRDVQAGEGQLRLDSLSRLFQVKLAAYLDHSLVGSQD